MVLNHTAFIGLGSNLNHPKKQIETAIEYLNKSMEIKVASVSSIYSSKPLVIENSTQTQPDYCNAAIKIHTALNPYDLLARTQAIEKIMGRARNSSRWSARIIDVDILLYDDLILNDYNLVVPHRGLIKRDFVLLPLIEIDENLQLPDGTKLQGILEKLQQKYVIGSIW